jgi:hypothetical protein
MGEVQIQEPKSEEDNQIINDEIDYIELVSDIPKYETVLTSALT